METAPGALGGSVPALSLVESGARALFSLWIHRIGAKRKHTDTICPWFQRGWGFLLSAKHFSKTDLTRNPDEGQMGWLCVVGGPTGALPTTTPSFLPPVPEGPD